MCFKCGLEDRLIANCPKQDTSDKKFHFNTENPKTRAYISTNIDKMLENSTYQSESQKMYEYMARMSTNAEIPRKYFGDSLQLTNWIL